MQKQAYMKFTRGASSEDDVQPRKKILAQPGTLYGSLASLLGQEKKSRLAMFSLASCHGGNVDFYFLSEVLASVVV